MGDRRREGQKGYLKDISQNVGAEKTDRRVDTENCYVESH